MRMFLGEYNPSVTEGSRVALPSKFRDQINSGSVVLSRGFEKCIFLYDMQDWTAESQKQLETPISDAKIRDLKRYMFASATDVPIDAQGRIVVPKSLLDYANIDKKLAVIGAGDHVEIWEKQAWETKLAQISAELEG